MKRKIALVTVSLTLLLSMFAGTLGCSDSGVEVSWDFATYTAAGSTRTEILENFADLVYEKSDGKMEVNVFAGGTLASGTSIFDTVSAGAVEMGSCPISFYISKMMLTGMALSPCWYWDTDIALAGRKAIVEEWQPAVDQFAENGITPILWLSSGFVELCFADEVTTDPDDAEGHTIATADSSVLAGMAQGLGSDYDNSDNKLLVTNASTGVIDAAFAPIEDYSAFGLDEYLPYVVMTQFFPATYSSIMNVDAFNALDADLQAIVLEAADEAEEAGLATCKTELEAALDELEADSNVTLTILNSTQQEAWWADMGAAMYNGIKFMLDSGTDYGVAGAAAGNWDAVEAIAEAAMGANSPFHDM